MITVDIQKDGSEKVKYDYDGYYAYIRHGLLSRYPNYAADSHWHDDLEFIYVLSGSMQYNVNGEIVHLQAGNGIFVNARQLHYGFSDTKEECDFLCILLHPLLLCATQSVESEFVVPVLTEQTMPYLLLKQDVAWQEAILRDIQEIYDCKDTVVAPMYIQHIFYHIWILLLENQGKIKQVSNRRDQKLTILKEMLSFIQKNYGDKISLGEIAASGNVSKSTCLTIFKEYLKDTPTNHLIGYRLKKATILLKETDCSVSEIAFLVGFSGVSYFTEMFRKNYGYAPGAYRKIVKREEL